MICLGSLLLQDGFVPKMQQAITWTSDDSKLYNGIWDQQVTIDLVPVPLMVFWSNLKFDKNSQCSGLKCAQPITMKFCTRHNSVTIVKCAKFLLWLVEYVMNKSITKFNWISNSIKILVVGRAPGLFSGPCYMVGIVGTTALVPYHVLKSLQLI